MLRYSIELRTKKICQRMWIFIIYKKKKKKNQQQLLNIGLFAVKSTSKKACP